MEPSGYEALATLSHPLFVFFKFPHLEAGSANAGADVGYSLQALAGPSKRLGPALLWGKARGQG